MNTELARGIESNFIPASSAFAVNHFFLDVDAKTIQSAFVHHSFPAKLDQFYLQRKVKAMGCLINKVASSSVVRSFLDVDGYNLTYDPLYLRSPHAFKVDLVPQVSSSLQQRHTNRDIDFPYTIIVRAIGMIKVYSSCWFLSTYHR